MGTWGIGSFENDIAIEWLYDFEANDFRLIDRTLAGVAHLTTADGLDAIEAQEALAAAECVAAAAGFPAANLPDVVTEWVAANRPITVREQYVMAARQATARIRTRSELRELWAEAGELEAWETAVADLQARLDQIEA